MQELYPDDIHRALIVLSRLPDGQFKRFMQVVGLYRALRPQPPMVSVSFDPLIPPLEQTAQVRIE